MKKKNLVAASALLLFLCMSLISCDKDDSLVVPEELLGQWMIDDGLMYFEGPPVYEFKKNKKFVIYANPGDGYTTGQSGTYTLDSGTSSSSILLTLIYKELDDKVTYKISKLDSDQMILVYISGDREGDMKFKKTEFKLH